MNKPKRQKIREAIKFLELAKEIVEFVAEDEEECLNNFPENLQSSERYYAIEENQGVLSDAVDDIESILDDIRGVL